VPPRARPPAAPAAPPRAAALVVAADFLLVITWFPVTVIIYERYFTKGCWAACCACFATCKVDAPSAEGAIVPERKSVAYIRTKVCPMFFRQRYALFALGLAVIVAFSAFLGATFQVAQDFPSLYVVTSPFYAFDTLTKSKFFISQDFKLPKHANRRQISFTQRIHQHAHRTIQNAGQHGGTWV
jgi:hypothetical protein